MSIAALNQVYDEVRRLAIAGSNLAAGDFRLKKIVPALEKSAEKAPVFGKVAEAVNRVVDGPSGESAQALLELGSLTTAILYTQGETGAAGDMPPLESIDMGLTVSNTSARMLKPLIEALTSTGSGRLELIRDAHERGAFKDLRLIKHAIRAIGDPYPEIGELVANDILPMYGKTIYAEIQSGLDIKGKGDDARRLRLLNRLDPERTRELVDQALEEGSKEVKIEAINCLEGREGAIGFLLGQAKAKAKDVRAAALKSLAPINVTEAVDVLKVAIAGADVDCVARYVHVNKNRELRSFIVEEAVRQRDELLGEGSAKKAKKKSDTTLITRFYELLHALRGRTDAPTEQFLLQCFAAQSRFRDVKAGYVDGEQINIRVAQLMLLSESKAALKQLLDMGSSVTPGLIEFSFLAASRSMSPQEAYNRFHKAYMTRPLGRSKADELALKISLAIGKVLTDVQWRRHYPHRAYWRGDIEQEVVPELYENVELDPRWLDTAIALNDLDVVIALKRKGHGGLLDYLGKYASGAMRKKVWSPSDEGRVLETMLDLDHPDAARIIVELITKGLKSAKYPILTWHFFHVIPKLPASAIEPLEALIPQVNDKLIDHFVAAVDGLKQRHKTPASATNSSEPSES